MPPSATLKPFTSYNASSISQFDVFDFDELRAIAQRGNDGILSMYVRNTFKFSNPDLYFRQRDAITGRVELRSMTFSKFKDEYLRSLHKHGVTLVFESQLLPYTTTYDPNTGPVDNTARIINLFELSHYASYIGQPLNQSSIAYTQLRAHIFDIICGGDLAVAKYLLYWIRQVVSGKRPMVALVICGLEGVGKSTLTTLISHLMAKRLVAHIRPTDIGKFNTITKGKALVICDEFSVSNNNSDCTSELKKLITEDEAVYEGKGQNSFASQNFSSFIFTCNPEQPLLNGRKYCHIHCNTPIPADQKDAFDAYCKAASDEKTNEEYLSLLIQMAHAWVPEEYLEVPVQCLRAETSATSVVYEDLKTSPELVLAKFLCSEAVNFLRKRELEFYVNAAEFKELADNYCNTYAKLKDPRFTIPGSTQTQRREFISNFFLNVINMQLIKNGTYYFQISLNNLLVCLKQGMPHNSQELDDLNKEIQLQHFIIDNVFIKGKSIHYENSNQNAEVNMNMQNGITDEVNNENYSNAQQQQRYNTPQEYENKIGELETQNKLLQSQMAMLFQRLDKAGF